MSGARQRREADAGRRPPVAWDRGPSETVVWRALQVMVFLVPLATSNFTWLRHVPGFGDVSAFTADQFHIVKVALLGMLLLFALAAWAWGALSRGVVLRRTSADWLVVVLLGWVVVSTALSIDRSTALLGAYRRYEGSLVFLLYGLAFFLVVQAARTPRRSRSLVQLFVLSSSVVAAYGVVQYLGFDLSLWGESTFGTNRGFSTFGNPNFLGGFLVVALPVALALALTERDARWRAVCWVGFLVIVAGWLAAFTRGAWIAGTLALALLLVAGLRKRIRPAPLDWGFLASAAVAAAFILARSLSSADVVTNVWERLRSALVFSSGSGRSRTQIWQAAWEAIKDRPVFGSGPDTFRLLFFRYRTPEYVSEIGRTSVADNAHNYALQLSATIGIPGALLLYGTVGWILALTAGQAFQRPKGSSPQQGGSGLLAAGLWAGSLGYVVHLLFGISVVGSTTFLWLFLGLLIAPQARETRIEPPAWGRIAAPLVAALCALGAVSIGVAVVADHYHAEMYAATASEQRIANAERAVRFNPFVDEYRTDLGRLYAEAFAVRLNRAEAEQSSGLDPTDALAAAYVDLDTAARTFSEAISRSRWEYDNYPALAEVYNWASGLDTAYTDDAIGTAGTGIDVSPLGLEARVQLAVALAKTGRTDEARTELEYAARHDPQYAEPRALLGDLALQAGRLEEARRYYEETLAIDPFYEPARQGLQAISTAESG